MKDLNKINPQKSVSDSEIKLYEEHFKINIPSIFVDFIKDYNGSQTQEILFFDKDKQLWIVNFFMEFSNSNTSIFELTSELNSGKDINFIPFAFDPGGWHYCLCINTKDFCSVYVNRWTDHEPENALIKIADTFEEFINGLNQE